jgi:hypothetical protein
MEFIIIIGILIVILAILFFVLQIDFKKMKELTENKELLEISNKFPENIEICKTILKKLNNENVKIEENSESTTNLYLVTSNKIIISNKKELFTRIQTIAHECIHSVQSKPMLLFNYIYSNIYLLYFIIISILTILKVINNGMLQVAILIIAGLVYYFIRSMLEMDAMIKARYVSKEYMENCNVIAKEDIERITNSYDIINKIGIKGSNFSLLFNVIIKVIIYCVICIIMI